MTIKATVSLNVDGNRLVYAGRGYQPEADFPRGEIIGEEVPHAGDKSAQVDTKHGRLFIAHADYQIVED